MKYTVEGFDQQLLVAMGLNAVDAVILRWFVDFYATDKMTVIADENGQEFKWVKYEAIIEDLPILGITNKQVIARHFDKMVKAGILEFYLHKKKGNYSCYKLTKKYSVLIEYGHQTTEKSRPIDSKVERGIDSKVETKDPSIKINPSINPKDNALAEKVTSEFSGQVVPQQKTAAPAEAGTPFQAIDAIFKAGSEKHTGQPYYKDAKESRQIKLLEARYTHDPERFLMLTRRFYWMITKLQDEFWNSQPFTPSAFNSLYNRIASYQPSADIQKREERGNQTDDEWFIEKYGNCTKQQLDYFFRAKMINKADYEMLVKRLLVEADS